MSNVVTKTFTTNTTWTAPAGVTRVTVTATPSSANRSFGGAANSDVGGTVGNSNLYFLDSNGSCWATGQNTNGPGELGDGTIVAKSTPTLVVGGHTFSSIAVNQNSGVIGIRTDGKTFAWGNNFAGQLGDNTSLPKSSPVLVVGGQTFIKVFAASSAFGLTPTGQLYAWGQNNAGQLGDGTVVSKSSPVLVQGGQTFVDVFVRGAQTVYAINTAGQLYAWGLNNAGQLGDNTIVSKSSPVLVLGGITNWKKLGLGQASKEYALGVTLDGKLYAWGDNSSGQLGLNDALARSSPTLVLGGFTDWIDAGGSSGFGAQAISMALRAGGQLYTMGYNNQGIGGYNDGSGTPRSSPTLVVGSRTYVKMSIGAFPQATTANGQMYLWGDNSQGNLGVGDVAARSSPTPVVGGFNFVAFGTNGLNICAVTADGILYDWGINSGGALGDGTTAAKSSPVQVSGSRGVVPFKPPTVTTVTVVPGTTYNVNARQPYYQSFGATVVSAGPVDSIVLTYKQ